MADPIIRVHDVAFPRFRAPDLDTMESFLLAFGMHRAARTEQTLYMRGTDADHHVHVTELGEAAFVGLTFNATSDDLAALAAATDTTVDANDEPGGGLVVHLTDPDGRRIDVIADAATHDPAPVTGHPPLNRGVERVRWNELQRVPLGPSQVKRFGHAALKTTDLARLLAWYRDTLGFLVSDYLHLGDETQPIGAFMRCDRGDHPTDHHTLLLVQTGEVKLGHCAWEVADFDDLMAGHDHLVSAEHRHYWGVGRHLLGGQVYDYWKDPFGFTVEHWTDSDLLTADVPAGARTLFEPINQWGPNPPADLDF